MLKKILVSAIISVALFFQIVSSGPLNVVLDHPRTFNERFIVRSMVDIANAQVTYQATQGNGNFGSFVDLQQAGLIDAASASGSKYGYALIMSFTPSSAGTVSRFNVTATPHLYGKTGKRSFYQDESFEVRGGDKNGSLAAVSDPLVETCLAPETCAIQSLRTLHGAEATFQATSGNGNFGTLAQLAEIRLIRAGWASGQFDGYNFAVTLAAQTPSEPASFRITAVPQNYGSTGTRSFFIGRDGVLRGADKGGLPADENDPTL